MKPFLFLGTRAEDDVADERVRRRAALRRPRRARRAPASGWSATRSAAVDLDDWSGIVLGGGPFNVSDPAETEVARRSTGSRPSCATSPLRVVEADFPFLGACYGIGTLGTLRRRRRRPDATASRSAPMHGRA